MIIYYPQILMRCPKSEHYVLYSVSNGWSDNDIAPDVKKFPFEIFGLILGASQ